MDQDGLLQGDDTVDAVQRRTRKPQSGKATMLAAAGGIDIQPSDDRDEQAPLLGSRRSGDGGDSGSSDEDGSETLAEAWAPTYEDFEGLPWYKRPSVLRSKLLKLNEADSFLGLLALDSIRLLSIGFRRYFDTENQPHLLPHLQGILCRQVDA
jgi:hypothetical protein